MVLGGSSTPNFWFLVSKFLLTTVLEMLIGSVQKAISSAVINDLWMLIQTKSSGAFFYHLAALKLIPTWDLVGYQGRLELINIFDAVLDIFNLSVVWSIFARFRTLNGRGIESLGLVHLLFLFFVVLHLILLLHQDLIVFLHLPIFFFSNILISINQGL